jgi:hypothetical protein
MECTVTPAISAREVIALVPREVKLAGFVVLLVVIFLGARMAGAHLGPVTTSHSQVSYTGGTGGTGGGMMMNMGGSPATTPAKSPRP